MEYLDLEEEKSPNLLSLIGDCDFYVKPEDI